MTQFYTIDHLPSRTIQIDGREYLFFSGTSYLGIPQHGQFRELLTEGLLRYGTAFGSSRNGNLQLRIYEEAEIALARFAGAPAALTVSSGMMAGQVVVNWLKSEGYSFLYAPGAHPAIWHEPTLSLPNLPFDTWAAQLPDLLRAATGHVVLCLNSLDAVRSEGYSFAWVNDVPENLDVTLVVDDSHGLGVTGPGGSGVLAQIPRRPNVRLIVTASLAKAMGLPGGVVFGEAHTLAAIRRTAFFGACSPMPPAYLYAYVRAGGLYAQQYQRLEQNILRIESGLANCGHFQHIPGYPVFYTPQDALYDRLLERGIFIYQFAYPSPTDKPNTRIVISALHTEEDLERLAEECGRG